MAIPILIKRNTAEFKEVKKLIMQDVPLATRKKLILLYSLKSYSKLDDRILLNAIKQDWDILYTFAYEALQEYISSGTKRLFRDENLHLYYFKYNSKTNSIELPFEFAGKHKKIVSKVWMQAPIAEKVKVMPLKSVPKKILKKRKVKSRK